MNYVEIDSNTEEGFQDLIFNIEENWDDEYGNYIIQVRGSYRGSLVGFKSVFKKGMKSGIIDGKVDNSAFYSDGITLISTGKESDEFIKVLSSLYGIKYKQQHMANETKLMSFALEGEPTYFNEGDIKFKVFYDDTNNLGLYSEMYINVSLQHGFLEIREKDIQYRNNIFSALTGKKYNSFIRLYKRTFNKI